MILPIEQDSQRFRQIVRGQVKQNLRKFMSNGELIGRLGRELVSIPLPEIDLPRFRFGGQSGGVGQGEGEESGLGRRVRRDTEDERQLTDPENLVGESGRS